MTISTLISWRWQTYWYSLRPLLQWATCGQRSRTCLHNSLMVLAVAQRKCLRLPLQHATLVFVTVIYITLHQQVMTRPYIAQGASRSNVNKEWGGSRWDRHFFMHSLAVWRTTFFLTVHTNSVRTPQRKWSNIMTNASLLMLFRYWRGICGLYFFLFCIRV